VGISEPLIGVGNCSKGTIKNSHFTNGNLHNLLGGRNGCYN
jgi:hypothetical protein